MWQRTRLGICLVEHCTQVYIWLKALVRPPTLENTLPRPVAFLSLFWQEGTKRQKSQPTSGQRGFHRGCRLSYVTRDRDTAGPVRGRWLASAHYYSGVNPKAADHLTQACDSRFDTSGDFSF